MTPAIARDAYLQDFRELENVLPGRKVPWVNQLRNQALGQFMAVGLPTTRQEEWKYTDVRPIEKRAFHPLVTDSKKVITQDIKPYLFENLTAHQLTFVDGHYVPELSSLHSLAAGVVISSLAQVLNENPELVEGYLGRRVDIESHGFAALNAAFLKDGAVIYLKSNATIEEPIHLLFLSSGRQEGVAYLRNLIIADDNCQATVIESYVGLGETPYLTNTITEIFAGKNASVEHYKLARESEWGYHVAGIHVDQARDSRYFSHNIAMGGRIVRNDMRTLLDGEGSECLLNGLYVAHGRQHIDNHTRIDHRKSHGTSREWYKGVLGGHARGIFNGRVVVHQDAQKTDAQQTNNNLLLSDDAEADSQPQLEIYADDVKCSHGSTVGQLDPDALFYLRSRAIDESLAKSLLVYAFANDILDRITLAPIRVQLEQFIAKRLLNTEGASIGKTMPGGKLI